MPRGVSPLVVASVSDAPPRKSRFEIRGVHSVVCQGSLDEHNRMLDSLARGLCDLHAARRASGRDRGPGKALELGHEPERSDLLRQGVVFGLISKGPCHATAPCIAELYIIATQLEQFDACTRSCRQ